MHAVGVYFRVWKKAMMLQFDAHCIIIGRRRVTERKQANDHDTERIPIKDSLTFRAAFSI